MDITPAWCSISDSSMNHTPESSPWKLLVRIEGRVQGVFFRDSTRREATALGLSGWVRNLGDGGVEACFVGPREACERALAFVRAGPPGADVTRVDVRWEKPAPGDASGSFEIR
jgi:acylphosphatase